jgi:hypothetical protein
MAKRPLLVVGAGAVVITVLEGIACGNPVAPRCPGPRCPIDAPSDATPEGMVVDSTAAATTPDAGIDAAPAAKP